VNGATYGPASGAWTGPITGTASTNAGSGTSIKSVSVAIEDTKTNKWWNGGAFVAPVQSFEPATGTSTWLFAITAGELSSGHTYCVIAKATDSVGNTADSSTVSFTYKLPATPPTVAITYPVNNTIYGTDWTGTITGTASSNSGAGTTITGVAVALEDTATAKWWSGSAFNLNTKTFVATSGTTSWTLPLPSKKLSSGSAYSVVAEATDNLGNTATSATVGFAYNTSPPVVTISYPVSGASYDANASSWSGAITGTAMDTKSQLAGLVVSVQQGAGANSCWTGTTNAFTAVCPNFLAVTTGTANWSLNLAAADLDNGASYSIIARASDSLGNVSTSDPVSFVYDTSAPSITTLYPGRMGECKGPCSTGIYWTITGSNFVSGATVSLPTTGAGADFGVVSGSVTVVDSTMIELQAKDTGSATGSATVVVTDPGESPATGSVAALSAAGFTALSIDGTGALRQGAGATLSLAVSGDGCTKWGSLAVYFSNPAITAGKVKCAGVTSPYTVFVPIAVSASAPLGDASVTVTSNCGCAAVSTNGLVVETANLGLITSSQSALKAPTSSFSDRPVAKRTGAGRSRGKTRSRGA
jgi:hypothetical protein